MKVMPDDSFLAFCAISLVIYLWSKCIKFMDYLEQRKISRQMRLEEDSRRCKERQREFADKERKKQEDNLMLEKETKRRELVVAHFEHKAVQSKRKEKRKRQMENNTKLVEELQNIWEDYTSTYILTQPTESTLYGITYNRLDELKRKEQAKGNWTSVVSEKYSQVVQAINERHKAKLAEENA